MPRVTGLSREQVSGDIAAVFDGHEQRYGAPLYNHMVLARRPAIFRGFRAMWDGLGEDAVLPSRLSDLLNVKVATLIGCGL